MPSVSFSLYSLLGQPYTTSQGLGSSQELYIAVCEEHLDLLSATVELLGAIVGSALGVVGSAAGVGRGDAPLGHRATNTPWNKPSGVRPDERIRHPKGDIR